MQPEISRSGRKSEDRLSNRYANEALKLIFVISERDFSSRRINEESSCTQGGAWEYAPWIQEDREGNDLMAR